MTFSDRRIVKLVEDEFIPVWESVAPAQLAVFDLGDGKEVKGTIGGDIALYFCLPDGRVFDILPALQAPAATFRAIREAARVFHEHGAVEGHLMGYHAQELAKLAATRKLTPEGARKLARSGRSELSARLGMGGAGTDAITISALSKTAMVTPAETITVVEPGGLWLYKAMVHDELGRGRLRTPEELKPIVFEGILGQSLAIGGVSVYGIDDVKAMSLVGD